MKKFFLAILACFAFIGVAEAQTITYLHAPPPPVGYPPNAGQYGANLYISGLAPDGNLAGVVRYYSIGSGRDPHSLNWWAQIEWDWQGNATFVAACPVITNQLSCPKRAPAGNEVTVNNVSVYDLVPNQGTGQFGAETAAYLYPVIVTP